MKTSLRRHTPAFLSALTLALVVSTSVLAGSVVAATVPSGFTDALVAAGLTWPTALAVADDGRVFVTEQSGALKVIKNGTLLPTPFIELTVRGQGGAANEEGLVGITLDPSFATNNFLYVYYTVPASGGNVTSHNRVSRFTANGDVAIPGSEQILFEVPGPSSGAHNGGALHFGADGKLYIAVGDHSNSANSQSMNTVKGKLLRISVDGTIPDDNPFFTTATGQNRAIWALGLRNPYRFAVQPGTGKILINDVGNGSFEEINEGVAGANYGWNLTEGPTNDPRFRSPLFAYPHQTPSRFLGCAIVGGAFYNPTAVTFPSFYVGKYFFADYCGEWMRVLDPPTGTAWEFATGVVQPVDLQVGNDGALYYLDRLAGSVRRITFASTNAAPVITSHPSSVTVAVGQSASFSVSAEGTPPHTFQWQRNNVNIAGATAATYTVPSAGLSDSGASFRAVVSNAIGTATSNRATLTVISNSVPTGTITVSADVYRAGDTIDYSGTGTDPEDGTLPPSALTWRVDFHHDTHFHPFVSDTSGASGSFTIPTLAETTANVWYRIHLTVRDSSGLTSASFVDVLPITVNLAFMTNPPGLQVRLDGPPLATPASIESVVGLQRTIGVVSPQTRNGQTYVFSSWAHGGTATQNIQTRAADTTYTANYVLSDGGAFSDTFDRPDSPDLGNDWLEVSEGLSISQTELRSAPIQNRFQMAIVPTFSSAAQTVAASFARQGRDRLDRFGVVLRYQDPQNYYLVSRRSGGTSVVQMSKVVNGHATVLATKAVPNPALNTFFRLEGQANGATLTLRLDGVHKLSVVDSTFSAGNVGIGLGNMSTTIGHSHRADNFAASGSDGATVPTLVLSAMPASVALDERSTLSWSTTGATACSFTSGLSGARPVTGNERTGALTSTTSFGMTCTGPGGSVSKSVSVTVGAPPDVAQLPSAADVHMSQAMDLPLSVRAFVILVPNKSHHEDVQRLISATNGYLLPMKVTLPAGATLSVVNADNGYEHNLTVRTETTQVFDTGRLAYGDLSAPAVLIPGSYSLIDGRYPWIRGEITVGEVQSEGTLLVGAFFLPENHLDEYRNLFRMNGFRIESEHKFTYGGRQQVLVIFSTDEDISQAGPKLRLLVTR